MWDLSLELKLLKSILTPTCSFNGKAYSLAKSEYFYNSATSALFTRLREVVENSSSFELPTYAFLIEDSKLPGGSKDTIASAINEIPIFESTGDLELVVKSLSELSKSREIYKIAHQATKTLSLDDDFQLTDVTNRLGESLLKVEQRDDLTSQITIGKGANEEAAKSVWRILHGPKDLNFIKLGLREFDEKTGGVRRTNLIIIGANSGGGKSLLAVNIMVRQYRLGLVAVLVSYEMSEDEVMIRILSIISEVDMNKIAKQELTSEEVQRVEIAWLEFNLVGAKFGNSYHIICPTEETTVPSIGFRVKAFKPDSLILDYINLLTTSSGADDSMWQTLGNISRESKLLANKLNCAIILLAQISEDYTLRYSKAIQDHANFVMGWIRDEQAIIERIITVHQMKARNAPLYSFNLIERFDIGQFRDPEQGDNYPRINNINDYLIDVKLESARHGISLHDPENLPKQLVNNNDDQIELIPLKVEAKPAEDLMYSANDLIPVDKNTLVFKSKRKSLLGQGKFSNDDDAI